LSVPGSWLNSDARPDPQALHPLLQPPKCNESVAESGGSTSPTPHTFVVVCSCGTQNVRGCGYGCGRGGYADAGAGPQTALLLRVPYFILIYSVVHTYFRYGLPPRRIHAFPSGWLASFASNYRKGNCSYPTTWATTQWFSSIVPQKHFDNAVFHSVYFGCKLIGR